MAISRDAMPGPRPPLDRPSPDGSARRRLAGSGFLAPAPTLALVLVAAVLSLASCTGEEAIPIDPANPPVTVPDLTEVSHLIEPTDQMREAAEQQCLDDPDLVDGYVRAVDSDSGAVLAEVTVACDQVEGR